MNGHDFTLEQNTEARMMLAVARRGLAAAINDAENGIGHLSCDDPKIMEQVRAHWRRLYDTYMNADALLSDLESCARHLTDGDKWEPNPIADGMKPMEMAKGCACFIAETPDGGLIIPSEPTPGENTAKRLANTLNALTGDVLLDATGIRLLGTQFLFAYHSRLDRPVDYGVNLTGMRFPDRLGLLDRADRHPGFLPLRPVVANGTGALERSGRELWAITAHTLDRILNLLSRQEIREIVVEELDFRNGGLSKKMNRIISRAGRNAVKAKLKDLEDNKGITVTKVNPAYTSQECPSCGYVNPRNRPTQEHFRCTCCGYRSQADINASHNILARRSREDGWRRIGRRQILAMLLREHDERFHPTGGHAAKSAATPRVVSTTPRVKVTSGRKYH